MAHFTNDCGFDALNHKIVTGDRVHESYERQNRNDIIMKLLWAIQIEGG